MTKRNLPRTPAPGDETRRLIRDLENSVSAIAWGCDALVHTLHDGQADRVDGAVWVAEKIREEATALLSHYKGLFRAIHKA